jgi:hypothetical protein
MHVDDAGRWKETKHCGGAGRNCRGDVPARIVESAFVQAVAEENSSLNLIAALPSLECVVTRWKFH